MATHPVSIISIIFYTWLCFHGKKTPIVIISTGSSQKPSKPTQTYYISDFFSRLEHGTCTNPLSKWFLEPVCLSHPFPSGWEEKTYWSSGRLTVILFPNKQARTIIFPSFSLFLVFVSIIFFSRQNSVSTMSSGHQGSSFLLFLMSQQAILPTSKTPARGIGNCFRKT